MIYVFIKPETVLEWLRYRIWGLAPGVVCDEIRYGSGIVECVHKNDDKCDAIPSNRILRIFWDGGYLEAVQTVKEEFEAKIQSQVIPEAIKPDNLGSYR